MQANSTRRLVVASGGDQVVGHVGLHALGAFADRLGLGNALPSRILPRGERMPLPDRGKVLVQWMLMLASGGESCADIEHLRAQEDLFGSTPSDSTLSGPSTGSQHRRATCCPRPSPRCEPTCSDVRAPPPRRHRSSWTSTPRSSRSTPRPNRGRAGTTRAAGASIRCSASPMAPARRSLGSCVQATRRPTQWPTTCASSTRLWPSCPRRSHRVTVPVTTQHSSPVPSWCAPTRRDARRALCGSLGPATSGSSSWPARMPRSTGRSSTWVYGTHGRAPRRKGLYYSPCQRE